MSQFSFGNIDETTTDGFDLAAMLENFEAAVNSMHSGSTAPTYALVGTGWRDTSSSPSLIKIWTGTVWVTTGSLNTTTGIFTPYYQGAALNVISTLSIGAGLTSGSGQLKLAMGLTPGTYNSAQVTVNADGNISVVSLATGSAISVGSVIGFMGSTPPTGFFELDGTNGLSRTTYSALYTHLNAEGLIISQGSKQSSQFGDGNGGTTFSLGDWRGEFIRGWDHGRGVDTSRALATFQAQAIQSHAHSIVVTGPGNPQLFNRIDGPQGVQGGTTPGYATQAEGGAETRPRNVALMWCIKY